MRAIRRNAQHFKRVDAEVGIKSLNRRCARASLQALVAWGRERKREESNTGVYNIYSHSTSERKDEFGENTQFGYYIDAIKTARTFPVA